MKEKKQSSNWVIALEYSASVWFSWLFFFFLFTMSAGALLAMTGIGVKYENYFAYNVLCIIFLSSNIVFSMWLVTRNSTRNLNKKYIIKDSQKITILALMFMPFISLPLILFASILGPAVPTLPIILGMVIGLIAIPEIIFYIVSKKYINNELSVPEYIVDKKINTIISIVIIALVAVVAVIVVLPKIMEAIEIGIL